jgi:dipeptidyl-peptidase-4
MTNRLAALRSLRLLAGLFAVLLTVPLVSPAQDRLKTMPGYEQYKKMSALMPKGFGKGGGKMGAPALPVAWKDGGKALEYQKDGKAYRYDIASRTATETGPAKGGRDFAGKGFAQGKRGGGGVARGRQATQATSPDGKLKAVHRDRNLYLTDIKAKSESQVTTDGSAQKRIKYGTASWVYGEELFQNTAMWWSPDSKALAYYRFDESKVLDYFLPLDQTRVQSRTGIEPYPKAGAENPVVDLFVYHVDPKKIVQIDVRDGKPFDNSVVGHYVYDVRWSPDGKELLFHRTNRRQNVLEFVAADPQTGKCRVILREEWPASWVMNHPPMQFLKDNKRFLWTSERTGWKNFYLYDLSGKLHATLTKHEFEVGPVVRLDEEAGVLWYMARSGDNPMKLQLHRVGLDGSGDKRLTDPAFLHSVNVAPNGKHFVDTAQTHDTTPFSRLLDAEGKVVAELAKTDTSGTDKLGLKPVELFTFKAADGVTDLYGMLHRPSNFDANKKYPLLVSVYAGPETNGARETYTTPNPLVEYGFLLATLDARSAAGRGKRFLDAIYQKLGVTEIDDLAAGVKALGQRSYVDRSRVGIFGGSYGGYASAMCLLRHPDVFQAACASSPVTDYRLYDSIYTERYMWLPQENRKGYDAGSAMTYVDNLKGRLILYYGTADDNVHPTNTLKLIRALQDAGKSFEVQVGPDRGHSGISQPRMMEFFIENLVMRPGTVISPGG